MTDAEAVALAASQPQPAATSQATATLPSRIGTMTIVAQVVGYLIATFGGLLAVYQTQHQQESWPGALILVIGLLYNACTHFGYVKGEAVTQNAIVDGLLRTGGPAAAAFLGVIIQKGTVSTAMDAALKTLQGSPGAPGSVPVVSSLPSSIVVPGSVYSPGDISHPK